MEQQPYQPPAQCFGAESFADLLGLLLRADARGDPDRALPGLLLLADDGCSPEQRRELFAAIRAERERLGIAARETVPLEEVGALWRRTRRPCAPPKPPKPPKPLVISWQRIAWRAQQEEANGKSPHEAAILAVNAERRLVATLNVWRGACKPAPR